jgi:hypothetical protein
MSSNHPEFFLQETRVGSLHCEDYQYQIPNAAFVGLPVTNLKGVRERDFCDLLQKYQNSITSVDIRCHWMPKMNSKEMFDSYVTSVLAILADPTFPENYVQSFSLTEFIGILNGPITSPLLTFLEKSRNSIESFEFSRRRSRSDTQVESPHFVKLMEQLGRLTHLKILATELRGGEVIINSLARLPYLQTLKVLNEVTPEDMECLSKSFSLLKHLTHLEINLEKDANGFYEMLESNCTLWKLVVSEVRSQECYQRLLLALSTNRSIEQFQVSSFKYNCVLDERIYDAFTVLASKNTVLQTYHFPPDVFRVHGDSFALRIVAFLKVIESNQAVKYLTIQTSNSSWDDVVQSLKQKRLHTLSIFPHGSEVQALEYNVMELFEADFLEQLVSIQITMHHILGSGSIVSDSILKSKLKHLKLSNVLNTSDLTDCLVGLLSQRSALEYIEIGSTLLELKESERIAEALRLDASNVNELIFRHCDSYISWKYLLSIIKSNHTLTRLLMDISFENAGREMAFLRRYIASPQCFLLETYPNVFDGSLSKWKKIHLMQSAVDELWKFLHSKRASNLLDPNTFKIMLSMYTDSNNMVYAVRHLKGLANHPSFLSSYLAVNEIEEKSSSQYHN